MEERLNKKSYGIPAAMVIAGLLIAGAILIRFNGDESGSQTAGGLTAGTGQEDVKAIDEDDDPALGNPLAPVTFINFGDFRCQFCMRFQKEIKPAIMEKYVKTGQVKYVYRDLISMGENSILAAEAANCAAEQKRYWEFADYLHSRGAGHDTIYTIESLSEIALSLNLDISLFKQCLASGKYKEEIKKDTNDAIANGAEGTPAVFINGRILNGLFPLSKYEEVIEEELLKNSRP